MCAIDKDRERRYETAAAMAADIRNFLSGNPISAHSPSAWYQVKKLVGRNKKLATTFASLAAVLLFSLLAISWFAIQTNQALTRAKTETKRATLAESELLSSNEQLKRQATQLEESTRLAFNAEATARESRDHAQEMQKNAEELAEDLAANAVQLKRQAAELEESTRLAVNAEALAKKSRDHAQEMQKMPRDSLKI